MSVHINAQKHVVSLQDKNLLIAVEKKNEPLVNSLLLEKGNPNLINKDGESLLMIAISNKDIVTINLLLKYGAKVNYRNNAQVSYDEEGRSNVMRLLFLKGLSPLDYAVMVKNPNIVNLLLEAGATLKTKKDDMQNILYTATKVGDIKMIRFLLDKGAKASDKTIQSAILHHILVNNYDIYGVSNAKNYELLDFWEHKGVDLSHETLSESRAMDRSSQRRKLKAYMDGYEDWKIERIPEERQAVVVSDLQSVDLVDVSSYEETDQLFLEAAERAKLRDDELSAEYLKSQEEFRGKIINFIVAVVITAVVAWSASHSTVIQKYWNQVKSWLNSLAYRIQNHKYWTQIKPWLNLIISQPPNNQPQNPPQARPVRQPSRQPASKARAKAPQKPSKPIIDKGWEKDNTLNIAVEFLTIEDMINPLRLRNEHEKAIRKMIWYMRRLELHRDDQIAQVLGNAGLLPHLKKLWNEIDPSMVRDVYKRSLYLIVENYGINDPRVVTFLEIMTNPVSKSEKKNKKATVKPQKDPVSKRKRKGVGLDRKRATD